MRPGGGALPCCTSADRPAPSASDGQSRPPVPGGFRTLEKEQAVRQGCQLAHASPGLSDEPSSSGAGADSWPCR